MLSTDHTHGLTNAFAGPDAADIIRQERPDGSVWLQSTKPLPPFSTRVTERLEYWARLAPNQPFLASRHSDSWQTVTYGDALTAVRSIAQALLDRGLENANPVLVLSGNGIEHALLSLACMHVGVIFCPVSVAYSTASQDFSRLRDIVDLVGPSLVFAADADVHGRALRSCIPPSTEVIVVKGDAGRPARSAAGSAQRVQRFAFLISKLSIDEGEITDKGVLNQRTIVRRHADLIDTLYSDHPPADTIVVQPIYRGRDLVQVIESVRPDRPAVGVAAVTQFPPAETTS